MAHNGFYSVSAAAIMAICLSSPVYPQDASSAAGSSGGARAGAQAPSNNAGPPAYQLKLQYTGEVWDNASGGIKTGTNSQQNIDASLKVDTQKAFGWQGGRFFIEGFYNNGIPLNDTYVGAAQDPSVLDTGQRNLVRLYQAYFDQRIGNTDVLFGIFDLESQFGITRPMDTFFNGAFAWTTTLDGSGQQGLNGPSTYPNTSLGLRIRQRIDDQWSIQAAVLNGMADNVASPQSTDVLVNRNNGALLIGEVDYTPIPHTKIFTGYWAYTGRFDTQNDFNPDGSVRQVFGSSGGYVGAATRLYTIEGARGLDGFVNIGFADSRVNEVTHAVNFGLNFTGPFNGRPRDRLAFGVGIAGSGDPYQQAQIALGNDVAQFETAFEVTYRAEINEWLTVQPNIQYIIHPGFDPTVRDDLLFGLHVEVRHLFNF
jgi:porin